MPRVPSVNGTSDRGVGYFDTSLEVISSSFEQSASAGQILSTFGPGFFLMNHILEQFDEQFANTPESVLSAMAKNYSAPFDVRVAAVQLMLNKGFDTSHPELFPYLVELKERERQGMADKTADIVEASEPARPVLTHHPKQTPPDILADILDAPAPIHK